MNLTLIAIAFITALGLKAPANLVDSQKPVVSRQAEAATNSNVPIVTNATNLQLAAGSVLAIDATTGTVLYAKNSDQTRPIASLTKIMTVLAVLKDHDPSDKITIPALSGYKPGEVIAKLVTGDTLTVKDLVAASLIPSDNDAADALAISTSGTKEKFYGKMNTIAKEWGLRNTTFASASGLQDAGNQSSAADLATLARLGLYNKLFSELTATKTMKITSEQGRVYTLSTTNDLLDGVRVIGLKTGYTPAAGECLVTRSVINGHEVITVMLGSRDRFGETARLLDWLSNNVSWHTTN